MTVAELKAYLGRYPDDLPIFVADDFYGGPDDDLTEFDFELYGEGRHLADGVPNKACLLVKL